MRAAILISFLLLGTVYPPGRASAQSPAPIIVQAANQPATSTASKPVTAATADVHSIPEAINLLERIKATNDEVLAKQKAALEKLDELQDAADQLRIFAKRG